MTYGLPEEVALFQDEPLAFDTALPGPEMQRWVLARYPDSGADVLLSGWARGTEAIARKAAAVALTYGKGRVVLIGFRAQHRAQTPAHVPVPVQRALLVDGGLSQGAARPQGRTAAFSRIAFTAAGPWKRPFSMKMRLVSTPATCSRRRCRGPARSSRTCVGSCSGTSVSGSMRTPARSSSATSAR